MYRWLASSYASPRRLLLAFARLLAPLLRLFRLLMSDATYRGGFWTLAVRQAPTSESQCSPLEGREVEQMKAQLARRYPGPQSLWKRPQVRMLRGMKRWRW